MTKRQLSDAFKLWDKEKNPGPSIVNLMDLKATDPGDFKVGVAYDGTNTIAEIVLERDGSSETIGRGVARRRKGEARNSSLGAMLALQRAFSDAAVRYQNSVDCYLGAHNDHEDDVYGMLVKMSAREAKQAVAAEKLARRKGAREKWEAANGGPWIPKGFKVEIPKREG